MATLPFLDRIEQPIMVDVAHRVPNYNFGRGLVRPPLYERHVWSELFPLKAGTDLSQLRLTSIGRRIMVRHVEAAAFASDLRAYCSTFGLDDPVVTECHGGMGGISLALAPDFRLIVVELDDVHFQIIQHNLEVYGFKSDPSLQVVHSDYLAVAHTLTQDIVFCDPPWPAAYRKLELLQLGINNIDVACIVNWLFAEGHCRHFVLRAPSNFDVKRLSEMVGESTIRESTISGMLYLYIQAVDTTG